MAHKSHKIIHVITSGCEYYHLAFGCHFLKHEEQSTGFVLGSDDECIDCHLLRQGYLLMDVTVLF